MLRRTGLCLLLTGLGTPSLWADLYTFTDLGNLGFGVAPTGLAINSSGQVAGGSYTTPARYHAFLYSGGSMSDLGTLGGIDSYGYGINVSGQVVGRSDLTGNAT